MPSRALAGLTLLAVGTALAGCGGGDESGADPVTALAVTLDIDGPGGEPPRTRTISCGRAPGGNARSNCGVLRVLAKLPPPTPAGAACTEIFGGPDVLELQGTLGDQPIDARFTRRNGCEIDRFDAFVPVLERLFPGYTPGAALGA